MSTRSRRTGAALFGAIALVAAASSDSPPAAGASGTVPPPTATAQTVARFQAIEQALAGAVGAGDKAPWDRVMDATCVVTSEEGEVIDKRKFLDDLRPLPPGLTGRIAVRDLTVQEYPGFALVRYRADEWETVFGERVPCAAARPVEDMFDHPQIVAEGLVDTYEHPTAGRFRGIRDPIHFPATTSERPRAAPAFGEHSSEILSDAGYSNDEIARLKTSGAIP